MSELQIYKFKTIDKPLTSKERAEVSSWSSRTTANSTGATFIYHYGGFSQEPKAVIKDYFDLMLYYSNWGTKRLILKFPRSHIDYDALVPFDISVDEYGSSSLELYRTSGYLIMDFEINNEEGHGDWLEEEDFDVAEFVELREAIINGDYSVLYLFWLKVSEIKGDENDYYDEDDDEDYYDEDDYDLPKPPPVPPQLKSINTAVQHFIDFFEIDKDLVKAAQSISKTIPREVVRKDYPKLIQQLSNQEKEDYLLRLLKGETRLDLALKKHLDGFLDISRSSKKAVSFAELRYKREQEKGKRMNEEKAEARRKYEAKMRKLDQSQANLWKGVYFNLDRKTGKSYDLAIKSLKDLKQLAIYKNEVVIFNIKMQQIRIDYKRSTSLKRRFEIAKL